jgi:hypothetical protein
VKGPPCVWCGEPAKREAYCWTCYAHRKRISPIIRRNPSHIPAGQLMVSQADRDYAARREARDTRKAEVRRKAGFTGERSHPRNRRVGR